MKIGHASVLLDEARGEHLPLLRHAVELRQLDAACSAGLKLRRALDDARRDLGEACRAAKLLDGEEAAVEIATLVAALEMFAGEAAMWLAVAPVLPPPPDVVLIAHVPGTAAELRAEQAARERAWQAQIDTVQARRRRANAGIVDLADWRGRRDKDRR